MYPERIVICGGGNAAHVLIAMLENWAVSVYAPFADEAERLRAGCRRAGGIRACDGETVWRGEPQSISSDPADVFPDADLVLLALPAHAHRVTLAAARPYLRSGAWVVALPARGGFDWEAAALLPDSVVLAGLQTLPWACRIVPGSYGEEVEILAIKEVVGVASRPATAIRDVAGTLSQILHISLEPVPSFLALTLANTGQLIHPGIMCGLNKGREETIFTLDEVPLFYHGVDGATADLLQKMDDDIQAIAEAVAIRLPHFNRQDVSSLHKWLLASYPTNIADSRSLHSALTTNQAYAGLRIPTRSVGSNAFTVDYAARYLAEDVPYGLVVSRGIAGLVGVPTPALDEVITWAQSRLGRRYLVNGTLSGSDLAETRAPQAYGVRNIIQAMEAN